MSFFFRSCGTRGSSGRPRSKDDHQPKNRPAVDGEFIAVDSVVQTVSVQVPGFVLNGLTHLPGFHIP